MNARTTHSQYIQHTHIHEGLTKGAPLTHIIPWHTNTHRCFVINTTEAQHTRHSREYTTHTQTIAHNSHMGTHTHM